MGGIRYGEPEEMATAFTDVSSFLPGINLSDAESPREAFTIAYLLRILHSPDPPLDANLAFDAIQRALPAMQDVGFDSELVRSIHPPRSCLLMMAV